MMEVLSELEIDLVFGGTTVTVLAGQALGYNGLQVGTTYIRVGSQPMNVTVVSANNDGSFNVKNNNTCEIFRFTSAPY